MAKLYYKHLGAAIYGLLGFLAAAVSMYCTPFVLLFDVGFQASGLLGPTAQQLRPVSMLFFKTFLNSWTFVGRGYFGSAIRIMMPWWHGCNMGFLSATMAAQTLTWSQAFVFVLVDCIMTSMRCFIPSGLLKRNSAAKLLRRSASYFRCPPPKGPDNEAMDLRTFRFYEVIVENDTQSTGYFTLILAYPVVKWLKYEFQLDMLDRFFYPTDNSIYFLLMLWLIDLLQDVILKVVALKSTGHDMHNMFSAPLGGPARLKFLMQWVACWTCSKFAYLGWGLRMLCLGTGFQNSSWCGDDPPYTSTVFYGPGATLNPDGSEAPWDAPPIW